jgi:hypothetical protein
MNLKRIGSITPKGEEAFRLMMSDMATVAEPSERRERALGIITDPSLCTPVLDAGFIDVEAQFATTLEFTEHVYSAIEPLGTAAIRDRGINLFIYCAFIDQLMKARARVTDSYFLDEKVKGQALAVIRNYRNSVFVFLNLYNLHRDDDVICPVLLGKAPNELGNALEKLAQNNKAFVSRAVLRLVINMFFDVKKIAYRKRPPMKGNAKTNSAGGALKELCSILFSQCSRNYDIARMEPKQMFDLVPNTVGLVGWKKYAKEAFTLEENAVHDFASGTQALAN